MPVVLNIELAYFEGTAMKYEFLRSYLDEALPKIGIIPVLEISETPLPSQYVKSCSVASVLGGTMNYVIRGSAIKNDPDRSEEWYVCVIVAFRHVIGKLGLMFDSDNLSNSRNGCAVFEKEILDFAESESVSFEDIFARTFLHEIGHCLNFPHDMEIKLMSQTHTLKDSSIPPYWNKNIFFEYSEKNRNYVEENPDLAKPGRELDYRAFLSEEEFAFSDSEKTLRKSLKLTLKSGDLDQIPDFSIGDNVALLLVLENISKIGVSLPLSLDQKDENLKIRIINPKGESIYYRRSVIECGHSPGTLKIRPGETRLVSLNLFFHSNGYLFPEQGTYLISCAIRKAGKQNIWYNSGLQEVRVQGISKEKSELFNKVYNRGFSKHFLLEGGMGPWFFKKCKAYLNSPSVRESGLSLPIGWIFLHSLKHELSQEKDSRSIKRLKKQLIKVYSQLHGEETCRIRRGKLFKELRQLYGDTYPKAKIDSFSLKNDEEEEYLNFKKIQIPRMYSPQRKK